MRGPKRLGALPSVTLAMLLVATPMAASSEVSPQAIACTVNYSASNWGGGNGFTATVTVANTGTTPIDGWTLGFSFGAGQRITEGWNATWTQASGAATATATNLSWNAAIAPGGSVGIGFNGTYSTNNPPPTAFTVNGSTCTT